MSKKPPKHSDSRQVNALGRRARQIGYLQPIEYFLIVCEGKKTEPEYFEEIKQLINTNHKHLVEVKIDIRPDATNTIFLLERAKKYVTELRGQVTQVWLVYDKDDFPLDRFDTTQFEAERLSSKDSESGIKYHAAWSNQCIEYWFLLHFENLQADIDREQYRHKLNQYFQQKGLGRYQKNRKNMFSTLREYGNLPLAMRYAEQRIKEHAGNTPSQSVPATRVHELVLELLRYLPVE